MGKILERLRCGEGVMVDIKNVNPAMLGKAVAFAGKGDWRYYLNGVWIVKRPEGGVYIVDANAILCVFMLIKRAEG